MYISLVNKYTQMKSNYNKINKEKRMKYKVLTGSLEFQKSKHPTQHLLTAAIQPDTHRQALINTLPTQPHYIKELYSQKANDSWDHTNMDKSMKNTTP